VPQKASCAAASAVPPGERTAMSTALALALLLLLLLLLLLWLLPAARATR